MFIVKIDAVLNSCRLAKERVRKFDHPIDRQVSVDRETYGTPPEDETGNIITSSPKISGTSTVRGRIFSFVLPIKRHQAS